MPLKVVPDEEGNVRFSVPTLSKLLSAEELSAQILRNLVHGFDSVAISNLLINMYAACRKLEESHRMFNILPFHDGVSWTSLYMVCTQ